MSEDITKEEVVNLLKKGRFLWYYFLRGFVILNPTIEGSTGTISVPMKLFLKLKEEELIDCTAKKFNDTEMYRSLYQIYFLK